MGFSNEKDYGLIFLCLVYGTPSLRLGHMKIEARHKAMVNAKLRVWYDTNLNLFCKPIIGLIVSNN